MPSVLAPEVAYPLQAGGRQVQFLFKVMSHTVISSCAQFNFFTIVIALITIIFLLFQAISIMTRPGLLKFAMWLYSGCLCYIFPSCIELHSMQSNWLCYMKYFCINPFYKCNIAKYVCAYSSFIFVQIYTCSECPKYTLAVNVQNIHKSPALLFIISGI